MSTIFESAVNFFVGLIDNQRTTVKPREFSNAFVVGDEGDICKYL